MGFYRRVPLFRGVCQVPARMRILSALGKPSQQGPISLALVEKGEELETCHDYDRDPKPLVVILCSNEQPLGQIQDRGHPEWNKYRYFQADGQVVFERITGPAER